MKKILIPAFILLVFLISFSCKKNSLTSPVATPTPISWGNSGSGDGQFSTPLWIAVDSGGNVYVDDQGNNRIQKFDNSGIYITQWVGSGQDIAVDNSYNVFVSVGNSIQKSNSVGTYITQWGSYGNCNVSCSNGQFYYPLGVAIDGNGNIYVVDAMNNRIQKFNNTGTYITQWGSKGSGNGQFDYPYGIAADNSGNVFVSESHNHRIQKFSNTGTYITQWGSLGSGNGQFYAASDGPFGIAVDGSGNVYVADTSNQRIEKFDGTGAYLKQWQCDGPYDVAVDTSGNVFVVESFSNKIKKFVP